MRSKAELIENADDLIMEHKTFEKGQDKQRSVLCNDWKMYWYILEIREYLNDKRN